jgi:Flp pilus assembly protein protease CpaA
MLLLTVIGFVITAAIVLLLFHASVEDIYKRSIGSLHVIVLYILVALYTIVTNTMSLETTYVFLFGFIMFIAIAVFSRGHFGIGDAMVIGALAWYLGSFAEFQTLLFAIAIVSVPWAVYWIVRYRKDNTLKGLIHGFKQTVPIDKVAVGDVLASDNFMQGLTRPQIDKFRQDGFITLTIKKPMPFIPVLFIAFFIILLL